jgi:hypothetical protein
MISDLKKVKLKTGCGELFLKVDYYPESDDRVINVYKDEFLNYSIVERIEYADYEIVLGDTTEELTETDLLDIEELKNDFGLYFDDLDRPNRLELAKQFFEYNDIECKIDDESLYIIVNSLDIEVSQNEIDNRAEIASEY